jgi:hypothetical protein
MACVVEGPLIPGRDDERITELTALAEEQQKVESKENVNGPIAKRLRSDPSIRPFHHMIQPWSSNFGIKPDWNIVAQAPDGTICGWLTAQLKESNGRKYIYLAEISTRRIRDKYYGGVGKALFDKLVASAAGYDFIYLYPMNDVVKNIYIKWGFSDPANVVGVSHQFYVLKKKPTEGFKTSLITPDKTVELFGQARTLYIGFDKYRRSILRDPELLKEFNDMLTDFEVEDAEFSAANEGLPPGEADAERLESQRTQLKEFLDSLPALKARRGGSKTARNTHRLKFLRKHHMTIRGYSLGELSKVSKVSRPILQQVYDRGIGAYKTNPTSVRMKGTFKKGVKAPYSKKLSKEQWAMARVYSFLDGNPKHDGDLRRKTRRHHK